MSIIEYITDIVEETCKKPTNIYGPGAWNHHIVPATKYAKLMAKKLGADEEIVEIATLLHDYASVKDSSLYEDHHIHGAQLAEEILLERGYPKEKIEIVKQCILTHRGSKPQEKTSKEARCVADGDAMSHFNAVPSLFHLAFFTHQLGIDEAQKFVMGKLERSWNKLSTEAKEIVKEKYEACKILFESQN